MAKQELQEAIKELGLSVSSEFVPFSKSRNAKEKSPSLNWRVTLKKGERDILTTDYGAGCAHAPSYKQFNMTKDETRAMLWECENGFAARLSCGGNSIGAKDRKCPLQPDKCDVVSALTMDSNVLDTSSFEEWAENFGYNKDSRKAEMTYQECLQIALALRNGVGEDGLRKLQEASQDY